MRSIFELGVDEAYAILKDQLKLDDLPPLEAIENEDWGRDLILSRLADLPGERLSQLGLSRSSDAEIDDGNSDG